MQPSGHGASGDVDGLILVRTGLLNEVEVRAEERVVRVGAGVTWGQVLAAAGPLGLTGLSGSAPGVSVTGYTLGGGVGWFSRKYGFASDSVRAIDIVDADGEPGRVTAESDPELFWALRGGGGDFAMVTALELELYPVPVLYGGRVIWPEHRTGEVYDAFLEITAEAPRGLSVWINRLRPPGAPPMVTLDLVYLGGALAEPGGGAGASGALAEPFLLGLLGLGLPHTADATRAKQAEVVADLEACVSGRKPYTVLSPGDTAAKSFSGSALARLREIKRARDPHNVFRANYPVLG